jgi:hypothetical protein
MLEETMDTLEDQDELEEEAQEEVDKVSVILWFVPDFCQLKCNPQRWEAIIAHLHLCQEKKCHEKTCFFFLKLTISCYEDSDRYSFFILHKSV